MRKIAAIVTIFILLMHVSIAQESKNYYVTIGVFSRVSSAEWLTNKAIEQHYSAQYGIHPNRRKVNHIYVYVLATSDKRKAFALAVKLRVETDYKDAWVFIGNLNEKIAPITTPLVEEKPEPIAEIVPFEESKNETKLAVDSVETKPAKPIIAIPPIKKPPGKAFYIKLVNAANGSEIKSGNIFIQEGLKATQYQSFKSAEIIYLEAPKNPRGTIAIIPQVPGYSATSLLFNYQNPEAEKGSQDELIIEIPLKKAKKGDYIDFDNVKFFKNASILQPASQNELDGVADLLKENPRYKIKIYGFVNGKQDRETITRGASSGFFEANPSLDQTNKKMTSQKLSEKRAETVKAYLISKGVEESQIETKGEGGKIPLYPENDSLGSLNDRIEIEFMKY
ncbi:MAG: OmpA family protein [Cyclobacteriaceae bacterium]|nr:OmpA family protein [Cyclobacteriaceae bacterium]